MTPPSNFDHRAVPFTERRYLVPFILITSLFFLWAFGVNLNDILIPHLKAAFQLSDFQSSFIQVAFFGGYFLAAFPAGRLMERIGYKKGILAGLMICATGAVLFVPASAVSAYGFFLFALFVMACGQSFLEVAANPYVTILGPPETSELRLNFAQAFNSVGSVLAPLLGGWLILTTNEYSPQQSSTMSAAQLESYRAAQAATVRLPYLLIAGFFLAVAVAIYLTHLPDVTETKAAGDANSASGGLRGLLAHKHLMKGVFAQFFYVGAQVGVASFVIRFTQHAAPGTTAKLAARFLFLHQLGFMLGRFAGSGMMKLIAAARLLALFSVACLICCCVALLGKGFVPVGAVILLGFFHSIQFPTIFALSIKNLGAYTKRGSSLLVMAIIGGGIFPAIMGRISDASNIQMAFIVPLICYAYVLYFAAAGYKPACRSSGRPAAVAPSGASAAGSEAS